MTQAKNEVTAIKKQKIKNTEGQKDAIYYQKTQHANFRGKPLFQALKKKKKKKKEKEEEEERKKERKKYNSQT